MYDNEDYRALLDKTKNCLCFQDWWMDAVCGKENWRGFVVKSGNFVKAICPLMIQKESLEEFITLCLVLHHITVCIITIHRNKNTVQN